MHETGFSHHAASLALIGHAGERLRVNAVLHRGGDIALGRALCQALDDKLPKILLAVGSRLARLEPVHDRCESAPGCVAYAGHQPIDIALLGGVWVESHISLSTARNDFSFFAAAFFNSS